MKIVLEENNKFKNIPEFFQNKTKLVKYLKTNFRTKQIIEECFRVILKQKKAMEIVQKQFCNKTKLLQNIPE